MARQRKPKLGLSFAAERELKSRLLRFVCSAAWLDHQFKTSADGIRYHDASAYPPPADTAPMVRCRDCGVAMPQNVVGSTGLCLDCYCGAVPWIQDAYGSSSFHEAMQYIRCTGVRLHEMRLDD